MRERPIWDQVHLKWVMPGPVKCACCNKCWLNSFGRCLYGGPFRGYLEIRDGERETRSTGSGTAVVETSARLETGVLETPPSS